MGFLDKNRFKSWFGVNWNGIAQENWNAIKKYCIDNASTSYINLCINQKALKNSKIYLAFYEVDNFPQIIRGITHYKFGIRIDGNCLGKDVDIKDKFGEFVKKCKEKSSDIFIKKNNKAWVFSFGTAEKLCDDADLKFDGLFFVTKKDNKTYLIKYK
jgi:hypothetical protein